MKININEMFEITKTDLDGRIGKIHCKDNSIETPMLLPVIHPVNQLVNTKIIKVEIILSPINLTKA